MNINLNWTGVLYNFQGKRAQNEARIIEEQKNQGTALI